MASLDDVKKQLQDLQDSSQDNGGEDDSDSTPSQTSSLINAGNKYKALKASPTQNPPAVGDVLSKLLGNSQQQLSDAKQQRDQEQFGAMMGKFGSMIGNGFSPLANNPINTSVYDDLMKSSQQPVSDLGTQQDLAKGALQQQMLKGQTSTELNQVNPQSDISKVMRDLYQQETGKEAAPDLSYADISKLEPSLARIFAARESAKNRNAFRDAASGTKLEAQDEKTQQKFAKDVSGLTQSSRSAIGKASQAKISVNRLLDIVNDPNATNQDLQSAYSDLNQVVSGTATMGGTEHQAYNTAFNKLADIQTYLTGDPHAPVIPEVKAHVADVARRMNSISDNVVNKHINTTSAGVSGWAKRHPEEYQNILQAVSEAPVESAAPASSSDRVNMMGPDGKVRAIPKNQVQDALDAGGKLVQ